MKRLIALLLAAGLMVSGLTGCSGIVSSGQTDESVTDSDESDESSEYKFRKDLAEKTIGISVSSLRGNYMKVFRTSLLNRMKKLGFKEQNVSVYENNGDLELELKMIDLLIDSDVDQLLICPNDSADVPAITDKVVASGIPLIYFNYVPDEAERQRWVDNNWNVSCVGGDRTQVARANNITKTALILVGGAINPERYEKSRLYAPDFSTEFRKARSSNDS